LTSRPSLLNPGAGPRARGRPREAVCPRKKPLVIVTRKLPDAIETRMRELFDTRLNLDDKPMTQADLIEAIQKADVLVPTVTDRIDSKVLVRAGENLKLIAISGRAWTISTSRRRWSAASPSPTRPAC